MKAFTLRELRYVSLHYRKTPTRDIAKKLGMRFNEFQYLLRVIMSIKAPKVKSPHPNNRELEHVSRPQAPNIISEMKRRELYALFKFAEGTSSPVLKEIAERRMKDLQR